MRRNLRELASTATRMDSTIMMKTWLELIRKIRTIHQPKNKWTRHNLKKMQLR